MTGGNQKQSAEVDGRQDRTVEALPGVLACQAGGCGGGGGGVVVVMDGVSGGGGVSFPGQMCVADAGARCTMGPRSRVPRRGQCVSDWERS